MKTPETTDGASMRRPQTDALLFAPTGPQQLEDAKNRLCESLFRIHGVGHRRAEKSGEHVYLACPNCRQTYGHAHERRRRHLTLNLDSYFDPMRFTKKSRNNVTRPRGYCICHKCNTVYTVEGLLAFEVQPDAGYVVGIQTRAAERYVVEDDEGNLVPDGPGKCSPVVNLPPGHPARVYIENRGFDASLLEAQFELLWCYEEAPEGEMYGNRFYRKHADGFRSTPQGRIIFQAKVHGVRNCWQGRFLEIRDRQGVNYLWHPYREVWVPEPVWDANGPPLKYSTGPGSLRNLSIAGYDHVVSHAKHSKEDWCVVTEGPLDAARAPKNGLALLGKSMSEAQAILIANYFKRVILGFDTDKAGRDACSGAESMLARFGVKTARYFPGHEATAQKEDLGAQSYAQVANNLRQILATF